MIVSQALPYETSELNHKELNEETHLDTIIEHHEDYVDPQSNLGAFNARKKSRIAKQNLSVIQQNIANNNELDHEYNTFSNA